MMANAKCHSARTARLWLGAFGSLVACSATPPGASGPASPTEAPLPTASERPAAASPPIAGATPAARATAADVPAGFERLLELKAASRIDSFNLSGGVTAMVLYPFESEASGTAETFWVTGAEVKPEPGAFAGLGAMGWVELDTRGRPYPVRSSFGEPSAAHSGERRITAMAGAPGERLLVIVTWTGGSGPVESTSALYEWRPIGAWKKLRDTGDSAVVGVYDVGVAPLGQGVVVVERNAGLDQPMFPQTHRLRALGTNAPTPSLALNARTADCLGAIDGLAQVADQLVVWGVSCATGTGKYMLEWWAPSSRRAEKQELSEAPETPSGTLVPQSNAIVVRPKGDIGYRLVLKDGRWAKDAQAGIAGVHETKKAFEEAGLSLGTFWDDAAGRVLVLTACRPEKATGSAAAAPRCLYRSSATPETAQTPATPPVGPDQPQR